MECIKCETIKKREKILVFLKFVSLFGRARAIFCRRLHCCYQKPISRKIRQIAIFFLNTVKHHFSLLSFIVVVIFIIIILDGQTHVRDSNFFGRIHIHVVIWIIQIGLSYSFSSFFQILI